MMMVLKLRQSYLTAEELRKVHGWQNLNSCLVVIQILLPILLMFVRYPG